MWSPSKTPIARYFVPERDSNSSMARKTFMAQEFLKIENGRRSVKSLVSLFQVRPTASGASHPGNIRQRNDLVCNALLRAGFQRFNRQCTLHSKSTGFCSAQRGKMSSASQFRADFMGIGSHIETFAADDSKIDLLRANLRNFMGIHVHEPRFSVHDLPFSSQFVERNALPLDGRDHGRSLVKVAMKLCEGGTNHRLVEDTHLMGFNDCAIPILGICHFAKLHCSHVLFVFAHQEILDLGASPDNDQEQTCREGVKGPAMANLLGFQTVPDNGYRVVAGHSRPLVDQQNTVIRTWRFHGKLVQ